MCTVKKECPQYVLLREAIKKQSIYTIRNLLWWQAPVNPIIKSHVNTPLHWAVLRFNDLQIIDILLDRGADIHAKNQYNHTPPQIAIAQNKDYVIGSIIKRNVPLGDDTCLLITEAIKQNNENLVKILLEYGDKEHRPVNVINAVILCVEMAQLRILNYLLSYCKYHKLNNQYISVETVMKSELKAKEISDLLYQYGFRIVSQEDEQNYDFIYTAVENKCHNMIKDVLKFNLNLNIINRKTGYTLLHVACIKRDFEMIKLLLKFNVDLNVKVMKVTEKSIEKNSTQNLQFIGKTALFIAVYKNNLQVTKLLLMNGADIKEEPHILNIATRRLSKKIIEVLLAHGADIDAIDKNGGTPLHHCITKDLKSHEYSNYPYFLATCQHDDQARKVIVNFLLMYGADPNNVKNIFSPLQVAIAEGYFNIAKLLLEYNANVNYSDAKGNTALHLAAYSNFTMIEILLEHNPNINAVNNIGMTALHLASIANNYNVIEKLLKLNANIQDVDKDGNTALHLTCQYCMNLDCIKILLNYNADVNTKNHKGETSLHTVVLRSISDSTIRIKIIMLLLFYHADINIRDNDGNTPLAIACKNGHNDITKVLLKNHAHVNCANNHGTTPLIFACKRQDSSNDIIMALLKYRADINCMDLDGCSAINLILEHGNDIFSKYEQY